MKGIVKPWRARKHWIVTSRTGRKPRSSLKRLTAEPGRGPSPALLEVPVHVHNHVDVPRRCRQDGLGTFAVQNRAEPDSSRLIVTYRNQDTQKLNEAVRAGRCAADELGPGVAVGGTDYARANASARSLTSITGRGSRTSRTGSPGPSSRPGLDRLVVRLDDGRRRRPLPSSLIH